MFKENVTCPGKVLGLITDFISLWHSNLSEMNYLTISILDTSEREDNVLRT